MEMPVSKQWTSARFWIIMSKFFLLIMAISKTKMLTKYEETVCYNSVKTFINTQTYGWLDMQADEWTAGRWGRLVDKNL